MCGGTIIFFGKIIPLTCRVDLHRHQPEFAPGVQVHAKQLRIFTLQCLEKSIKCIMLFKFRDS